MSRINPNLSRLLLSKEQLRVTKLPLLELMKVKMDNNSESTKVVLNNNNRHNQFLSPQLEL